MTPRPLSSEERAAVSDAVAAAERTTAGEIFCIVARRSADYREAPLAWAAGAALALPLLAVWLGWTPGWPGWAAQSSAPDVRGAVVAYAAAQALVFALVAGLVSAPQVRLWLTPPGLKRAHVRRAALEQFLSKGLHLTEARTGVLIYVSLAEHRVEVIADEGVHRLVDPGVWAECVTQLTASLRRGALAEGLIDAVNQCGEVLAERFPPRPGDVNELPDHVVEL